MKSYKIISLSFLVFLFDQITKILAIRIETLTSNPTLIGFIKLNLVKNTGAAFSILKNQTSLLSIISLLVSVILIILILQKSFHPLFQGLSFAFLLGGTIGNGLDRWRFGYVTDFIQLIPINFPIFNFADISINIALFLIIFDRFRNRKL